MLPCREAAVIKFIYGHSVLFITINKNIRQHKKAQLKTTIVVSDYGLDDRAIGFRFPAGTKGYFL
jgi:hypothetical protein